MSKGQDYYREQILEAAPVAVYTATNTAMLSYPYIIGRPEERSPTLASQASSYIMDSGIGEDTFSNDEVLTAAHDTGADTVVPKDVIGDPSTTTTAVIDMLTRVNDLDVIIPLQSSENTSHADHYYELADELSDYGFDIGEYTVGIGGIKNLSVTEQIMTVLEFQERVGYVDVHAFGCGFHHDWVAAIRKRPELLTSLDNSSVRAYVNNTNVVDSNMNVTEYVLPRGSCSTVLTSMMRETMLYMFNHIIGPKVRDEDAIDEFDDSRLSELFKTL